MPGAGRRSWKRRIGTFNEYIAFGVPWSIRVQLSWNSDSDARIRSHSLSSNSVPGGRAEPSQIYLEHIQPREKESFYEPSPTQRSCLVNNSSAFYSLPPTHTCCLHWASSTHWKVTSSLTSAWQPAALINSLTVILAGQPTRFPRLLFMSHSLLLLWAVCSPSCPRDLLLS